MRAQQYRFPIAVIQSICLLLLLQQCAWFFGEKDPVDLVKPQPMGGYETLSARIHYPRAIREAGIEGTVVINALISVEGQVKQTRVIEPLYPELDQIVTNAIKRTPFEPATRQGEPEEVWISIPFIFAFNEWSSKNTPFNTFSMTIHPDPAYKNFDVEIEGQLRDGLEWPLRFECLLPFNATNPWVKAGDGASIPSSIVKDDKGEWLVFQVSNSNLAFGFTYKSMEEVFDQKFLYEFTMNHALPDWALRVVYGSQTVNFTQAPDRMVTLNNGETQFEYDFKSQDPYESRYLDIELQK
ncbi:MAG: energy transducer TonB [Candidatus Marinimicrobia bacterium]|jgi:TonB family protein|nr:energy transducer TonB [Candidatus Neomarinimicrobiota bacterium]MBT3576750.1 energy transducer TonB [Candidatus Neomarinimicrobiota bacterium]MBT3678958.1 energy transducer TonB [Candidatus Neomarinimicrobiota bacterium]MBT3950215.1 energy transducer TonB [Candidatus Neomarinimicrobiota bacterium]MBT4252171.1 energy transducer TonB [Candidatus Neomarinimicrobiota bacterium]